MFKITEILKATQGRLINKGKQDGFDAVGIDSRTLTAGQIFVAIKGDNFDGHDFINDSIKKGAACIILELDYDNLSSKGKIKQLSQCFPEVTFIGVGDTVKALGDLARFHRDRFDIPVVAITGSNGKTTTKDMVAFVLSKRFNVLKTEGTKNNQIGVAMALLGLNKRHQAAVLEFGTNHFGEIAYLTGISSPTIGVITNIGPSHLEFLRDLKGVLREKCSLIDNLRHPCIGVLNADDELLSGLLSSGAEQSVLFGYGIKNSSDFSAGSVKTTSAGTTFIMNQRNAFNLKTPGSHNVYNALAAIGVAVILGMSNDDISAAISSFTFPSGRLNILTVNDATIIDDSYNSNPLSLGKALDTLSDFKTKGRRIMVMGDMLELGDSEDEFHKKAGRDVSQVCDVLVAVGKLSELTAKAAKACGFDTDKIFLCESSQQAREILIKKVSPKKDDVILIKGSRRMKMEEAIPKKV